MYRIVVLFWVLIKYCASSLNHEYETIIKMFIAQCVKTKSTGQSRFQLTVEPLVPEPQISPPSSPVIFRLKQREAEREAEAAKRHGNAHTVLAPPTDAPKFTSILDMSYYDD